MKRKTKQDEADEKRRAEMLRQTEQELTQHFDTILKDNYQRLADIPDEEWQAALEADAAEVIANA